MISYHSCIFEKMGMFAVEMCPIYYEEPRSLLDKNISNSQLTWLPGGGVTSIYTGTGRAIFWGAFFRAGNKFWGIIFGKIIGGHKCWVIIFSITNNGPITRYLFPT